MAEAPAPPAAESRRHARERVMRRGVLVHAPSGRSFSCLIVDISLGGARLHLLGPNLPTSSLTLVDVRVGATYELRVVWSNWLLMGVAFKAGAAISTH